MSRLARDYLRPHWARIAAAILCMIATAGCTAVTAWLLKPALDALFKAGQGDIGRLALISSAIVALSAFKAVLAYGAGILLADTVRRVTTRLQEQLFARLMHADLARLSEKHSGVHQTNFLQNTSVLATGVTTALVGVFRDFPTMVGLIAVMFYMDWELSLFALLIGPPVAYLARRLSKKAGKAMGGSIKNSNELAKRIAETLSGIRIVKAYGREDYEAARAAALIEGRTQQLFKAQRASLAAAPFTEAIGSIGIAGAIFYGGLRVFHHTLTPTAFLTFIGVMLQAFQPMRTLSNLATVFSQSVRAAQAIFEELDVDPTIEDAPGAKALVPAGVKGARIRFEDVSFSYGPEVPALNHIAFEVNPGETVALVGPSGAGRTTIFNLLLRFYEPTSGRVLIDDQDIRSVTIGSLRDQIALVAQEATLFDDTVAANISYGAKGQLGASPADIASAARHAAADDFITRLPRGYETPRRRRRRPAFGRPTPAHRDRPRLPQGRADSPSRRSDLGSRHAFGSAGPSRAL